MVQWFSYILKMIEVGSLPKSIGYNNEQICISQNTKIDVIILYYLFYNFVSNDAAFTIVSSYPHIIILLVML